MKPRYFHIINKQGRFFTTPYYGYASSHNLLIRLSSVFRSNLFACPGKNFRLASIDPFASISAPRSSSSRFFFTSIIASYFRIGLLEQLTMAAQSYQLDDVSIFVIPYQQEVAIDVAFQATFVFPA